jgi:NAD(P)-dependent dehydrogenase (short-subunit alcohol dehydrogenase family)
VLVNNAGTYGRKGFADGGQSDQSFGTMDYESWNYAFAINTMAPLKMCEAFLDNVAASDQKKMITISSVMGSIASPPGGGSLAYGSTKAAANFVMSSLAMALRGKGITVMALHPGWVKTDMGSAAAPTTPEQSISGLKNVIANASLETSGKFVGFDGAKVP